ncbi:MAG TPA: YicC/YloC family endoribonuclease [Candidatus Eisenbacteria bacterium]|nr:YicC/YloC family endoribonuclease [Candidatus Eisenbacteria bacterium]
MIRSMTGYGRGEVLVDGLRLAAEVRSVNHRFCELSARLPRALASYEAEARKIVMERTNRGKITLAVTWGENGEEVHDPTGTLSLDERAADRYMELLQALKKKYSLSGDVELQTFASMPNLFVWSEVRRDPEFYLGLLRDVVTAATEDMIRMKETEGSALRKDLEMRVESVRDRVAKIRERAPLKVRETAEKYRERIRILLEGADLSEDRMAQEVAILSEKLDSTEECVRLEAHCDHFRKLLTTESAPGRKLNFLLQEMNREINTIGSKSADVPIVEQVVEIKEELERIREQVQNIE